VKKAPSGEREGLSSCHQSRPPWAFGLVWETGSGVKCGRAEPAHPRDWSPELGWPSWESPEMTREAVFSEGRALRVRKYGPDANQGIPFPPDGFTMSRWPRGPMPRSSRSLISGRAKPAPPRGASPARMASRGKTGDNVRGGFLGGTHSVRPRCEAGRMARTFITAGGSARGRWFNGSARGPLWVFLAGVRSPPLRDQANRNAGRLAGKTLG